MSHISEAPVERVTIPVLQQWKEDGRRIVMTTSARLSVSFGEVVANLLRAYEA